MPLDDIDRALSGGSTVIELPLQPQIGDQYLIHAKRPWRLTAFGKEIAPGAYFAVQNSNGWEISFIFNSERVKGIVQCPPEAAG